MIRTRSTQPSNRGFPRLGLWRLTCWPLAFTVLLASQIALGAPAADPAAGSTEKINYKKRFKRGRFSFEFAKADIFDIVKAISEITRKNFIIPEKLKSQKITILSPSEINAAEAYQVFLAALEINGITIIRSGKFYKLVSSKDAIKRPIPTCVSPTDECPRHPSRLITELIPLKNVEASQVNSVLKSLVSKDGALTIFAPSNSLIISEYAGNIARIKKILTALDVRGFDDELRIVQVQYATANEIADKLTQVFDVQRPGRGGTKSSRRSSPKPKKSKSTDSGDDSEVMISKIIADERTNQIIIKANSRSFEAIRDMIARLDVPISESEQGRVHVYYLANAKAEDLASTLSSLAQGAQTRAPPKVRRSKNKPGGGPTTQAKQFASAAVLFEGEVRITADRTTNSLIIVSSAHDYRAMKKIIEKLDRPRRQVYVEAAILEVNTSDSEDFFIHYHTPGRFSKDDIGDTLGGGGTMGFLQSGSFSSPDSGISSTLSPAGLLGAAGGSIAGIVGKNFQIPGTELNIPSFGVVLRWLQKDSNARVISTPHILTMNNEEASIEVGKRIPFQRGVSLPGGGGLSSALGGLGGLAGGGTAQRAIGGMGGLGGLFSSTDRIDVSLRLTLTPSITQNSQVRLDVEQQIEDVVGQEGSTGQPITSSRSIKSSVVMDDQQSVVLGGLMRDNITEGVAKVPILGDLPLLGWLFKSKTTKVEKVNLLLVLTPYIIEDTGDFQRILERKMEEHEEFTAQYYGRHESYRAHIDYSRKVGPLARLARRVEDESKKIENGGTGTADEILVAPLKKIDGRGALPTPSPSTSPITPTEITPRRDPREVDSSRDSGGEN